MAERWLGRGTQIQIKTTQLGGAVFFALLASLLLFGDSLAIFVTRKLNGPLPDGWKVAQYFSLTPDSQYVVYTQFLWVDTYSIHELYRAPVDGGEPLTLSGDLVPTGSVKSFQITSDSQYVVYLADQEQADRYELYSVPINGGTPQKLNANLVTGGDVEEFKLTPNGQGVVYSADQEIDDTRELYSNWITGGTPYKLNGTLHEDGDVMDFQITANSLGVVYFADQLTGYGNELHSVLINGTDGRKIADWVWDFQITPNDQQVVYVAGMDLDVRELFQVSILGGVPLNLSGPYVGPTFRVESFTISDPSGYAVFLADKEVDGIYELYSVPVLGGVPVKINPSLSTEQGIEAYALGGAWVAYLSDHATTGVFELYCEAIGGGPEVKLNGVLGPEGDVLDFAFTPNNQGLVFRADASVDEQVELFSAPVAGGALYALNAALPTGGSVLDFTLSPNSLVVVYRADVHEPHRWELFAVSIFGGESIQLNSPLVEDGDLEPHYQVVSDNQRVVYEADQDVYLLYELYLAQEGYGVYLPDLARP